LSLVVCYYKNKSMVASVLLVPTRWIGESLCGYRVMCLR